MMRATNTTRTVTTARQARAANNAVSVVIIVLLTLSRALLPAREWRLTAEVVSNVVGNGLLILACAAVGLLILARRPGNIIGWLLTLIALVFAVGEFAGAYASRALPGAVWAALVPNLLWIVALPLGGTVLLLLFPTGRLPSPRWRPILWAVAAATLVLMLALALSPGPLEYVPGHVQNPIGVQGNAAAAIDLAIPVAGAGVLGSAVAALSSLVLRWRRARGVERQQLKWLAYTAVVLLLMEFGSDFLPHGLYVLVTTAVSVLVPVAIGVAITRYRLYDIDRLVNRTLVYGTLTALLGGLYASVVLLLGQRFGGLDARPPSWAVAGATLTVAALFRPVRRRVQQAVDQRFDRRRYNVAQTVEAFSIRLRDQIDMDTLSTELIAVVDQTLQPTTASLWLRPPSPSRRVHLDS
jgi:hypothetical protein